MRHGKKINHLGRTSAHRKAMLSNMASSLILHKRVTTTVAKAKALRKYVEPLLTKSKNDTTHSRRTIFSYLQNKDSLKVLFDEVAGKIANRPGGYTRILKTGNRLGDNAEMCIIELVDYNENLLGATAEAAKPKTRRRSAKKKDTDATATATAPATTATAATSVETAPKAASTEEPAADTAADSPASEPKNEE